MVNTMKIPTGNTLKVKSKPYDQKYNTSQLWNNLSAAWAQRSQIRDYPFSMYVKVSKKLTFFTSWYARGVKKCWFFGKFYVRTNECSLRLPWRQCLHQTSRRNHATIRCKKEKSFPVDKYMLQVKNKSTTYSWIEFIRS